MSGPRSESILSDALVQDLVAAGQVDVIVGLPTLDNARTVGSVVRAVHEAFAGPLARDRTMLLAADGGSRDGTPAIVRDAQTADAKTLLEAHTMRTVHRITAPYHGVPGRGSALRVLFGAADLCSARAVAVVSADAIALDAAAVAGLVEPILRGNAELVKPVMLRGPWDAPLVTQLVRPLLRAAYGKRLLEPLATQFACSGALAAEALGELGWSEPFAQYGVDVWLVARAMARGSPITQVWAPGAVEPPHGHRPPLTEVFTQILDGLATCLETQEAGWLAIRGSEPIPLIGTPPRPEARRPAFDVASFGAAFAQGIRDLDPILAPTLSAETLDELRRAAERRPPRISDDLWVRAVYEALAAAHHHALPRPQIVRGMLPVYLGRLASFLAETADASVESAEARLEELALIFEERKPGLQTLWTQPPTR
jgi:hypothetical protein